VRSLTYQREDTISVSQGSIFAKVRQLNLKARLKGKPTSPFSLCALIYKGHKSKLKAEPNQRETTEMRIYRDILHQLMYICNLLLQSGKMKKVIIIGATSGIGYEVARIYQQQGWLIGIAGRQTDKLALLKEKAPEQTEIQQIDVTSENAIKNLSALIEKTGGMDLFLLSSGVGYQNSSLDSDLELSTVQTNAVGFTRMVTAAYHYFEKQGYGHLAVISSIAGTKGLGAAPSYSATKRFQNTYIDALAQLTRMKKNSIHFTDIRPGFVKTPILKDEKYPLLMKPDMVAQKIVKALNGKKRRIVIDWRYSILVFFWRLIPEWLWERLPIRN